MISNETNLNLIIMLINRYFVWSLCLLIPNFLNIGFYIIKANKSSKLFGIMLSIFFSAQYTYVYTSIILINFFFLINRLYWNNLKSHKYSNVACKQLFHKIQFI